MSRDYVHINHHVPGAGRGPGEGEPLGHRVNNVCILRFLCAPSFQGTTHDAQQVAPPAHVQPRGVTSVRNPTADRTGLPKRLWGWSPALAGGAASPNTNRLGSPGTGRQPTARCPCAVGPSPDAGLNKCAKYTHTRM